MTDICPEAKAMPGADVVVTHQAFEGVVCRTQKIRSGMVLLKRFLPEPVQARLLAIARKLGKGPGGFYLPTYDDGSHLHCKMMCLGRHWNPIKGAYESRRTNFDDASPPLIPAEFLCVCTARAAGTRQPHPPFQLTHGVPVVSLSRVRVCAAPTGYVSGTPWLRRCARTSCVPASKRATGVASAPLRPHALPLRRRARSTLTLPCATTTRLPGRWACTKTSTSRGRRWMRGARWCRCLSVTLPRLRTPSAARSRTTRSTASGSTLAMSCTWRSRRACAVRGPEVALTLTHRLPSLAVASVFGGPSRMVFHGVNKVHSHTAPAPLAALSGRLNITFRQSQMPDEARGGNAEHK